MQNKGRSGYPDEPQIDMQLLSGSPEIMARVPRRPPAGAMESIKPEPQPYPSRQQPQSQPYSRQQPYAAAQQPRPNTPRRGEEPHARQGRGETYQSYSTARSRRRKRRVNAPRLIAFSLAALAVIGAVLFFVLPKAGGGSGGGSSGGSGSGSGSGGGIFSGIFGGGAGGGNGGFASNGFATYRGASAIPMDGGELIFLNHGFYIYELKNGELEQYLGGSADMGQDGTNKNPVLFGKNLIWLDGKTLRASPASDPHAIEDLDVEGDMMTFDEKNVYLLDDDEKLLYTIDPTTLDYTSVDFPYEINNSGGFTPDDGGTYAIAWDGTVYFTAKSAEYEAQTYTIDPATGESGLFMPEQDEVLRGLCVDKSGFYYMGKEAVYHLPHGSDEPEEVFSYTDTILAEGWGEKEPGYKPSSIYLDGGYLYVSFLKLMDEGYGVYRMGLDGSNATEIMLPTDMWNYMEGKTVVVKNDWICYVHGAFHIGKNGIDAEIYNDGTKGYGYREIDVPFGSSSGGGGGNNTKTPENDSDSGSSGSDASGSGGNSGSDDDSEGRRTSNINTGGLIMGKYEMDPDIPREAYVEFFDNGTCGFFYEGYFLTFNYAVDGNEITFTATDEELSLEDSKFAEMIVASTGEIEDDGSIQHTNGIFLPPQ